MRHLREFPIVLTAMLPLVGGCVTQQSYAPATDAATLELKIKAGDEIRVVTTRRERLSFEVTEIRGDRFVGVTVEPYDKELRPAGEPVEVSFDELAMLEVSRVSKTGTALAAAALVTVAALAVVVGPVAVVPLMPAVP